MDMDKYQELAQRTANVPDSFRKIMNGCMGLNGEAGECIDILKKHMYQGHALDREKLIDECSDVLWYVAELATGLGIKMSEIAEHNVEKLRRRYPEGFKAERSIHRPEA